MQWPSNSNNSPFQLGDLLVEGRILVSVLNRTRLSMSRVGTDSSSSAILPFPGNSGLKVTIPCNRIAFNGPPLVATIRPYLLALVHHMSRAFPLLESSVPSPVIPREREATTTNKSPKSRGLRIQEPPAPSNSPQGIRNVSSKTPNPPQNEQWGS